MTDQATQVVWYRRRRTVSILAAAVAVLIAATIGTSIMGHHGSPARRVAATPVAWQSPAPIMPRPAHRRSYGTEPSVGCVPGSIRTCLLARSQHYGAVIDETTTGGSTWHPVWTDASPQLSLSNEIQVSHPTCASPTFCVASTFGVDGTSSPGGVASTTCLPPACYSPVTVGAYQPSPSLQPAQLVLLDPTTSTATVAANPTGLDLAPDPATPTSCPTSTACYELAVGGLVRVAPDGSLVVVGLAPTAVVGGGGQPASQPVSFAGLLPPALDCHVSSISSDTTCSVVGAAMTTWRVPAGWAPPQPPVAPRITMPILVGPGVPLADQAVCPSGVDCPTIPVAASDTHAVPANLAAGELMPSPGPSLQAEATTFAAGRFVALVVQGTQTGAIETIVQDTRGVWAVLPGTRALMATPPQWGVAGAWQPLVVPLGSSSLVMASSAPTPPAPSVLVWTGGGWIAPVPATAVSNSLDPQTGVCTPTGCLFIGTMSSPTPAPLAAIAARVGHRLWVATTPPLVPTHPTTRKD
ncbi:MAG: hypothetical protein ACYCTL_12705 [Acidimicrobiales bacterium]